MVVDTEALVEIANQEYFRQYLSRDNQKVEVYELACLYWIYLNMSEASWDEKTLALME